MRAAIRALAHIFAINYSREHYLFRERRKILQS